MKRAGISVGLLVVLTVLCSFLSWRLISVTERMSDQIAAVETAVRENNEQVAAQSLDSLIQSWEQEHSFLVALSGRVHCEPIEAALSASLVWYEDGNSGELLATLSQLSACVSELRELQTPLLTNLF